MAYGSPHRRASASSSPASARASSFRSRSRRPSAAQLRHGTPLGFTRETNRTVSPTYLLDACRATRQLIEMGAPAGLYHCVNSGSCTWLEFAEELARQLGVEPRLTPVRMSDVKLRAERPKFCALSNAKLLSLGIEMAPWQDALQRHLRSLPVQAGPQLMDPLL